MADKVDLLLKDYASGMLDLKINSRTKWITRQRHYEKIGGSTHNKIAPQEQRLIIIEEDSQLQTMIDQKEILDELMKTTSKDEQDIIKYRFKYDMSWQNLGLRMMQDSSNLRKKYVKFKEKVRSLIYW